MSKSRQKCALLILDGLGDLPVSELGGLTPLEAAETPLLNRLAGVGLYGLLDPVAPGKIPNTHSGSSPLLGLFPDQVGRLRRGPVESSGAGRVLQSGEIAMRVNFATAEMREGKLVVTDRRAGRIRRGTKELAGSLQDIDLGDGVKGMFYSTDQHRGVLILSGPGLSEAIGDTDPGDIDLPAPMLSCQALLPEAEFTAGKIDRFILEAYGRLHEHPVNQSRLARGKPAANMLITRGAGAWFRVDNILHERGISGAVVAGCNTIKGLGRMFGFDAITDPRFTADLDTDLDAKVSAVVTALADHEMVYLHVKAPDILAHDHLAAAKRDFIQRFDQAMVPLEESGFMIAISADHTTDSNSGHHTADPVPALLYDPSCPLSSGPVNFGESACRGGNMERQSSHHFLLRVVQSMGY